MDTWTYFMTLTMPSCHITVPQNLALQPHPIARNKTVAVTKLSAGTTILTVPCLCKVLLPAEKSLRCDFCLCIPDPNQNALRRCTGCISYWYCDTKCTHDPHMMYYTPIIMENYKVSSRTGAHTKSIARILTSTAHLANFPNSSLTKSST